MLQIICFILIVLGGVFVGYSIFGLNRLIKTVHVQKKSQMQKDLMRQSFYFFLILTVFTIIFFAVNDWLNSVELMLSFISIIFFLISVFIFLLILELKAAWQIQEKEGESGQAISENTEKFVPEQEKLLDIVNTTASILLSSDVENFEKNLWDCMGMLTKSINVDRMYIWKNYMKEGTLYCTQLYEWSEDTEPQQGNDLTVDVLFPEDWYGRLSANQFVNGVVRTFPDYSREHLQAQGILSILVVPVFIKNSFWGFVGFDDCRHERIFSDNEKSILRTASLLITTTMRKNNTILDLVHEREDAIFTTKTKSYFLSNMSHELRTPINAITGMAAIARKTTNLEQINDSLGKIEMASRQLLGIINDILDMSKIEAGKMVLVKEPFDLAATFANIRSIISVTAVEKKQNLSVDIPKGMSFAVVGDEIRLSQILLNLLSNAVKFTPKNGKIDVTLRLLSEDNETLEYEVKVCDTGIGISQEQQVHLFQSFEQIDNHVSRKFGGTGLGLAISKRIAVMMGGDITVKSIPNEGSCFTVRFRLFKQTEIQQEKNPEKSPQEEMVRFSGNIVLLAEDIEINREIAVTLLEDMGLKVETAENGRLALEMFKKNSDKYDMIFMDLHMPEMDGYEATRSIRALPDEKAKRIPIVAMTANAFTEDVERCLKAGMNDHVAKPIDIEKLYSVVKKFLASTDHAN